MCQKDTFNLEPNWDRMIQWMKSVYRRDPKAGLKLIKASFPSLSTEKAHAIGRGELQLQVCNED